MSGDKEKEKVEPQKFRALDINEAVTVFSALKIADRNINAKGNTKESDTAGYYRIQVSQGIEMSRILEEGGYRYEDSKSTTANLIALAGGTQLGSVEKRAIIAHAVVGAVLSDEFLEIKKMGKSGDSGKYVDGLCREIYRSLREDKSVTDYKAAYDEIFNQLKVTENANKLLEIADNGKKGIKTVQVKATEAFHKAEAEYLIKDSKYVSGGLKKNLGEKFKGCKTDEQIKDFAKVLGNIKLMGKSEAVDKFLEDKVELKNAVDEFCSGKESSIKENSVMKSVKSAFRNLGVQLGGSKTLPPKQKEIKEEKGFGGF